MSAPSTSPAARPATYDHLRPTDADLPDGVYRVVGTGETTVTLLRVADADGRRVATGEVVAVDRADLDGFEPVGNPDGNRPVGAAVASRLRTAYWSVRAFGRQLLAHPLASAAALALVLVGTGGDGVVPLPDVALGVSILLGSLGLAYVGSGRL
jgi:hypothetical protein